MDRASPGPSGTVIQSASPSRPSADPVANQDDGGRGAAHIDVPTAIDALRCAGGQQTDESHSRCKCGSQSGQGRRPSADVPQWVRATPPCRSSAEALELHHMWGGWLAIFHTKSCAALLPVCRDQLSGLPSVLRYLARAGAGGSELYVANDALASCQASARSHVHAWHVYFGSMYTEKCTPDVCSVLMWRAWLPAGG